MTMPTSAGSVNVEITLSTESIDRTRRLIAAIRKVTAAFDDAADDLAAALAAFPTADAVPVQALENALERSEQHHSRDAVTGQYVTEDYAAEHPDTTVTEVDR